MKKLFYFLLVLFAFFSLMPLTGCNDKVEEPSGDIEDGNNDSGETNEPEIPVVITQETLDAAIFNDDTVDYDGEPHSLIVTNVPKEVKITYQNNEKVNPGRYMVKATLEYENFKSVKTAFLKINHIKSEITAVDDQIVFIYGGNVMPSYEINNDKQQVKFEVYSGDKQVDINNLYVVGDYTVRIYAERDTLYDNVEKTITLHVVNSLYGLSFEDKTVLYEENKLHKLELSGLDNIPEGFSYRYTNNEGSEVGSYYALAEILDDKGNVVETHAATLTVEYAENDEFNEYLDNFFIEYLEEDQLSVNIFCENPYNFGLIHYDNPVWYTYERDSEEEFDKAKAYFNDLITELKTFENAHLSPLQQVAYNKVLAFLEENIVLYDIKDIEFSNLAYIDQFGGYVAEFPTYMEAYSLRSVAEVEDIISYINSTGTAFASYLDYVDDKAAAGYAYSNYTITKMREFLKDLIDQGDDYYLADAINAKIDAIEDFLNDEEKIMYKEQVETAMDTVFMDAVKDLYDGLESRLNLLPSDKEGYWAKYENGKELYLTRLQSLLGLNNFDIETYIAEIDAAMASANDAVLTTQSTLVRKYSISTYKQLEEVLSRYPIFNGTPNEMITYLKEFASTVVPALKTDPKIEINEMDEASAKASSAVAYYMKSALDNTGSEHITLNPLKLVDKNDVLGTLAHEGYPGHLYAYVHSKEIGQHYLSTIMTSTAHAEGWATYVELKLYEYAKANTNNKNLIEVIDYLYANQMMGFLLETRLDVGIHYQGWTSEDVYTYMVELGYLSGEENEKFKELVSAKEIYNQIIEMPATFAAYGYGKLFFVNLHEEAQTVLGALYNEVEFNEMLHSHGWTSLGELENVYNEYMKAKCHQYGYEFK